MVLFLELTLPVLTLLQLLLNLLKLLPLWFLDNLIILWHLALLHRQLNRPEVRLPNQIHGVKTSWDKKCLFVVDVGGVGELLVVKAI